MRLYRIPKALSDKAFTDMKSKRDAAAAKQADMKGNQYKKLVYIVMRGLGKITED